MSLRRIAEIHRRRGNEKDALKCLRKSARISKEISDFEGLADCYYHISTVFQLRRDFQKSQEYVDKCLETAEISGDLVQIAKAHKTLGSLHTRMGRDKEAHRAKSKAVEYAKDSGDLHLLSKCYNDEGVSYYKLGKNEEAMRSLEKGLESARMIGDASAIAYTLSNMASVYIEKPNLVKAEEFLDEAVEIFNFIREDRMVASAYLSYGFIYKMRGDWTKAMEFFKKNIGLTTKIGSPTDLFESYKTIGQIASEKDRRKGLFYLRKASAIAEAVEEGSLGESLRSEIRIALSEVTDEARAL